MQVKIESSSAQPAPAKPEREGTTVARSSARTGGEPPGGTVRETPARDIDVDVSARLQRARQAIEAWRAADGAPAAFERLPLEVDALAERIRSDPRRALVAQGDVGATRAHRLLTQLPPPVREGLAEQGARPVSTGAAASVGTENRLAAQVDSERFEAARRAVESRSDAAAGRLARAAWIRSRGL